MNMKYAIRRFALLAAIAPLAAVAAFDPLPESFTRAKWIYAPPAANPPSNAFLRLTLDIPKPVKSAWIRTFREKYAGAWVDAQPLRLRPCAQFVNFRGHIKAQEADIADRLSPGRHVLAFGLYRQERGCFGMILCGEIEFADGEKRRLFSEAAQFKASGNEVAGWREPSFDDSSWEPAWEQGDARMYPWARYGETMRMFALPDEYARYAEFLRTGGGGFSEQALLAEPDSPNARVVYSGDTPGIETNGKILPPYVATEIPIVASAASEEYVKHLRDAGVDILCLGRLWRGTYATADGGYDFSAFDGCVRRLLAINPNARFFLYYRNGAGLPKDWADRHPDELVGYAVESSNVSEGAYGGNPRVPSFASRLYRDEERAFLKLFGDYVRAQPWGRRILGIHCGFGGSGDGMPCGANCMPDTGLRMTEAFRRYLSDKYKTDEALRKAWGDASVTLHAAAVPDKVVRRGSGAYLRDLSDPRDRRVADYYDCYHKTFVEFMTEFGAAVKSALPGRLAGAYFGYGILGYSPEGNTARIGELLRGKEIDYFYATTRGYNLTDGLHRNIASLCRRYGKFTSIEGDVRPHVAIGRAEERWRCKTPEETRATFSKIVANALVRGTGWQMVDFGLNMTGARPWFDIPEALEPMATGVREWRRRWTKPVRSPNEIAVVFDLEQVWKQGHPERPRTEPMANNIATFPLQTLNFSGFAYDTLSPADYIASKDAYKAVVFLNLFEATPASREAIRKRLATDGATAFWCFAPGLLDSAAGYSEKAMHALTGMAISFVKDARTFTMKDIAGKACASLFAAPTSWKDAPRAFVADAAAEVRAKWADDGTAAIVRKKNADGTVSVFFGLAPHDSGEWAAYLKEAGCSPVAQPGFMVRRGNGFLEVFSGKGTTVPGESAIHKDKISQSGMAKIRLPFAVGTLRDVFTDEVYPLAYGNSILSADKPRTWLFREDVETEGCVSQARWLWAEPYADPPTNAFLRLAFDVKGAVKNAWFYQFNDKWCEHYVNGKRVHPRLWPGQRERFFGHVKGYGVDIKPLLVEGRNVLAFKLGRFQRGCYGIMLRGEVEFEDGRTLRLVSNPSMVKGSGEEQAGWREPNFDDSSWKPAVSRGDVRLSPWAAYGNVAEIFMFPDEFAAYKAKQCEGFQEQALLAEPAETQVKVVYSGMTPGISVNGGKPFSPDRLSSVSSASTAAQDRMFIRARKAGLPSFEIGASHVSACGGGNFDFSTLDMAVRHILSLWPEAHIFLSYGIRDTAASAWLDRHPEDIAQYAIKRPKSLSWGDYYGNPRVPSFASKAAREEQRRFILALGEFCRRQPWGRRVVGMHISYGGSGDGMPFGCHCMPDIGPRMTEAFRRRLREKYGTDDALRKAWDDPSVTLDTATVPDEKTRAGSGAFLRDFADGRDRRRADFLEAYHGEFNDYMLSFCKSVKEAFPGRLAGSYYGYILLSYEPEGSTARCEELLKSPYVDYMKATTRGYNLTDGQVRHLFSLFRRYGKFGSIEGDVRTHIGLLPGQAEPQWCCRSPYETRSTVAKFVMNARLLGAAFHTVDFGIENVKWLDCPEAMEPVEASIRMWQRDFESPKDLAADTAVLFDVNQVWREGSPNYNATRYYQDNLVTFALQTLNFSGYAYDMLAPEDYVASGRRYKAVIFLNTCYDTAALRAAVKKARADGAMSVWCATPGLSTEKGYSVQSMREITGIDLDFVREARPFQAKGVGGNAGYEPYATPGNWKDSPRVFARDAHAETCAVWTDDNTPAFVRKRLADGTQAAFLGFPYNRSTQWAALLKSAGCHAFTPPGFMVRRDSRYVMVFTGKGALIPPESAVVKGQLSQDVNIPVLLERPCKILVDEMTGEIVAHDTDRFSLVSEVPRLWVLRME